MSGRSFLNGRVILHAGDCLAVLPTLSANSVDAVVTDPPYHLTSGNQAFDWKSMGPNGPKRPNIGKTNKQGRGHQTGFMGQKWDGGNIAFDPATWAAVLRVLKPGGHLLAFGGTRTYHRLVCAIEDAGFEIRDQIAWVFGSGFPKSHDASKGIDKHLGAAREVVGSKLGRPGYSLKQNDTDAHERRAYGQFTDADSECAVTAPATDAARQWQGWGTALKPAHEPIVLARKPLQGTVAENLLAWGVGAINIDDCRVVTAPDDLAAMQNRSGKTTDNNVFGAGVGGSRNGTWQPTSEGRWPANLIHDGSEEVLACFPESKSSEPCVPTGSRQRQSGFHMTDGSGGFGDSGSAARFFYTAKADSDDRIGSKHPTVKPLDLIQYLVRLVTPPNGTVLDCFAGTGTTGEAAWREGFSAILIEREAEYIADIERRMKLCLAGPDERSREAIKARTKDKPADHGPLFAGDAA